MSSSIFSDLGLSLSLPSQHDHLLTFVPHGKDSPLENMVIEQCSWTEGVNRLFEFQVDVLTGLADFDPNVLIGEEITLGLLQADGTRRLWHAILDESEALGGDGGLARFRLVLRPWVCGMQKHREQNVYVHKTVLGTATEIPEDYPSGNFYTQVSGGPHARATSEERSGICAALAGGSWPELSF